MSNTVRRYDPLEEEYNAMARNTRARTLLDQRRRVLALHDANIAKCREAFTAALGNFEYPDDHAYDLSGLTEAMLDAYLAAREDGALSAWAERLVRVYAKGKRTGVDHASDLDVCMELLEVDA